MHFQFTFVYIASIFVYVVYCLFILFALGGSLFLAMLKFFAFHHFGLFFFCAFLQFIKKEQQECSIYFDCCDFESSISVAEREKPML